MDIKCYSQRLLNPFRGMLCIIECNSAEAVTMDGIVWDIYVRNSALIKDLEQAQHHHQHKRIQTSEIRYGRWSKKNGLQRGPTIDSDDFEEMADKGKVVYQYLCQHSDGIPYPYQDKHELWLLDNNNKPLALLDSLVYQEDIESEHSINWTAGIACKETFQSVIFSSDKNTTARNAGDYLNQIVNSYSNKTALWIHRREDGSGIGVDGINIEPNLINMEFSANDIPKKILNSDLFNQKQQQLIIEYYSWLAPWLLVLQSIPDEQRATLEQQASKNALIIEKQYLLYPKVIDSKIVKAALVETMMRKNNTEIVAEKVESVEYLELNNPTHHLNK